MHDYQEPPITLGELQTWVEDRYASVSELRECSQDVDIMEDVAYHADQCAVHATFFGCPDSIFDEDMMTPLTALRIMGKLLRWIRKEKFNESPFLNVGEAAAYLRTKPESVYRAVESRRLNGGKVGKELRFTREQLNQYACETVAPAKTQRRRRKGA